ncbi:hypothetical protein BpHYR1_005834 [Brachionus plicatilis]|uniref:Uncharacterized protein n=1 Tax=Brachionus plicatilis TaxID=10195 RepID=A0A3M7PMU0_BRAPC|nr:hypothetical protein BpHYR1_005834 [Brachionus plicatilis]
MIIMKLIMRFDIITSKPFLIEYPVFLLPLNSNETFGSLRIKFQTGLCDGGKFVGLTVLYYI